MPQKAVRGSIFRASCFKLKIFRVQYKIDLLKGRKEGKENDIRLK